MCLNNSNKRQATTLIEVVAALALLASLLVALLAAHDRLGKQFRRAEERLVAIEAADRLLMKWTSMEPMQIPAAVGQLGGKNPLWWSVTMRADDNLEVLGIQIAELKVYSGSERTPELPLVSVEFLTTSAVGLPTK